MTHLSRALGEPELIDAEPCPRELGRVATDETKSWTLVACVLASSMAFIDGSALTVALPALKTSLGVELAAVQWVINAYILALAALTLIGGAVADARGRRDTLMLGCGIFAGASIACALAPNVSTLVAARFFQGVGGALLTPASLALIGEVYPRDERAAAIGTWAAASALTTAGGPLLGGWLTENLGWEAIFWINPPLALAAIALLGLRVPKGPTKRVPFDVLGAALLTVALGAGAYALTALGGGEAGAAGESSSSGFWVALSIGAVATLSFVIHERRVASPMMPPYLFGKSSFTRLNLTTLLVYGGLAVVTFILPFDLIERRGLTATAAGAAFLPFTLAVGLLSRRMGAVADRFGPTPLLVGGPCVAALGYVLVGALADRSYALGVLVPMGVVGLGFALLVAPLTAGVMSSVDDADSGLASGINNTASRVAQFSGVALAGILAPWGLGMGMAAAAALTLIGGLVLVIRRSSLEPSTAG